MPDHDLQTIAFPTLDDAHVVELAECTGAASRTFEDGDVLIEVGDPDFGFFVIRSGAVEILDVTADEPRTITIHRRGQFTGDVSHVTGAPSIVRAVARGTTVVDELSSDAVRKMINVCPDTGDVVLQAFLARRQLLRESGTFTGLRVFGSRYSQDAFRIRDFLSKNHVLYTWLDLEADPDVEVLLRTFGVEPADTPVVACARKMLLRNPSNRELADEIGIRRPIESAPYDLAIVGSGPAGLAAAVYAASEGLKTVLLDTVAPGGQAGASMRIENYLGFPTGITGGELIDRAVLQANKFGARLSVPTRVTAVTFEGRNTRLALECGEILDARCLLIATGAHYRRLPVDDCPRFEGCGVYYAATRDEARLCGGADVVVVGGGNSAGQAAVFLAGHARRVLLVVRGADLYASMSSYLADRILQTDGIEVRLGTSIARMHGGRMLERVDLVDAQGREERVATPAVFSFIGAVPRTDWLPADVEKDERGFVKTGLALAHDPARLGGRAPFHLETSRRGVFAAGDVRAGSIKRVASAVGEGSMAVQFVHEVLAGA